MKALAVMAALTSSGLSQRRISQWWNTPRSELYGLTPHVAYERPWMRYEVLALANKDADEWANAEPHAVEENDRHVG